MPHGSPDRTPGFPSAFLFTFVSFVIASSAPYTSVLSRLFPGPLLHTVWAVFSEPVLEPLSFCWWIQEWVQLRPFSWIWNPCEPTSYWLFPPRRFTGTSVGMLRMQSLLSLLPSEMGFQYLWLIPAFRHLGQNLEVHDSSFFLLRYLSPYSSGRYGPVRLSQLLLTGPGPPSWFRSQSALPPSGSPLQPISWAGTSPAFWITVPCLGSLSVALMMAAADVIQH